MRLLINLNLLLNCVLLHSSKAFISPSKRPIPRNYVFTTKLSSHFSRRDVIAQSLSVLPFAFGRGDARAESDALVDIPMVRIQLPKGGFGRNFVAVPLMVNGEGPYDFMIDTGLTLELITPHLQQALHLPKSTPVSLETLSAAGSQMVDALAELKKVELFLGKGSTYPLPVPLHAVVGDFPQEHIDPKHDPIEGMLGMEVLSQLDVDFDFPAGRIRLFPPGKTKEKIGNKLVPIPAVVINETGLLGIRLTIPSDKPRQPIVAFLDCGSSFSVVNWQGAKLLGLPNRDDPVYKKAQIMAIGVDGKPQALPVLNAPLTFTGDVMTKDGKPVGFASPPANWKPWHDASLAVGDLPVFSTVLGDGIRPYQGPAALLGLDVLSQRRVILEATTKPGSRDRRVWVSPN